MTIVFDLTHYKLPANVDVIDYIGEDDIFDSMKPIGIFSTHKNAEDAIKVLVQQPGFRDWPGGFRIFSITLDKIGAWETGFISSDDA